MKKNIFILAMVAMFVSTNLMAQPVETKKAETKKECCKGEKKDCTKAEKKECAKGEKKADCNKKAETKQK